MTNNSDQFDGDLKLIDEDHQVDGIGSGIAIKGMGTFKFKLEDDNGQVHTIRVPNSLYVPSLKRVLLAPNHWAQEAQDNAPNPRGERGWPHMMTALSSIGTRASPSAPYF